jgi:SET domain
MSQSDVKLFHDFPGVIARHIQGELRDIIGAGLFANRPFRCGETVMSLDHNQAQSSSILAWEDVEDEDDNRVAAIAPGWYFHPDRKHPFWFLNHSCLPNIAYCDWANLNNESSIPLLACRDIRAGEEVVIDYSTMTAKDDGPKSGVPWSMKCFCGVNGCRRLLASFAALPLPLQLKILLTRQPFAGMVPAFIVSEVPELVDELRTDAPDLLQRLEEVLEKQLSLARLLDKGSKSCWEASPALWSAAPKKK